MRMAANPGLTAIQLLRLAEQLRPCTGQLGVFLQQALLLQGSPTLRLLLQLQQRRLPVLHLCRQPSSTRLRFNCFIHVKQPSFTSPRTVNSHVMGEKL